MKIGKPINQKVSDSIWNSIKRPINNSGYSLMDNLIRGQVWDSVGDLIDDLVDNSIGNLIDESITYKIWT